MKDKHHPIIVFQEVLQALRILVSRNDSVNRHGQKHPEWQSQPGEWALKTKREYVEHENERMC